MLQSDKSEKSLIRCNTFKRNLQGVNSELNIQKRDELGEEVDSEKSINHMHQTQYSQCVKENPKTMKATLCEFQCEISKKLIILPKELRCDTCALKFFKLAIKILNKFYSIYLWIPYNQLRTICFPKDSPCEPNVVLYVFSCQYSSQI